MRELRDNFQRGAVSAYLVGLVVLAVVLVGGVLILKHNQAPAVNDKPAITQTADSTTKTSGTKTSEPTNQTVATTNNSTTSSATNTLTATGATDDYVPSDLAATGPRETFAAIFGLVLASGAGYAFYYYRKSAKLVEQKLLGK